MMLVRTYVAASPIEGLGVYADELIPSGTLIWQLNSKFVMTFSAADIEKLPPHTKEFVHRYGFPHLTLGGGHVVLELDNGRFMNHSKKPNTDFTAFERGYAIRDIHPGEELTCNYHEFDPTFAGDFVTFTPTVSNGQSGLHVTQS